MLYAKNPPATAPAGRPPTTLIHVMVLLSGLLLWASCAQSEITFISGKDAYLSGNFIEAERIWLELADKGDAQSQFFLGVLYDQGAGSVPENVKAASTWFEAAARQGHANAQFNLGNAYKRGRGVPQSEQQAVFWWQQAADLGSPNAQFNLAIQYYQGKGVEKSWDKAVQYFNKAARSGHSKAQELIDNKQVPLLDDDTQAMAQTGASAPGHPPGSVNPETTETSSSSDQNRTVSNPATNLTTALPANTSASTATKTVTKTGTRTPPPTSTPEQWLHNQDPSHYTIQLAASGSKEGVERFIAKHRLTGKTAYFLSSKSGKPLYYLLMGSFSTRHQANLYIESLTSDLRANKPWARPFADMQNLSGS